MERGDPVGYGPVGFNAAELAGALISGGSQATLDELLIGKEDPAACLSPRAVTGTCRLCGEVRRLTFEHIPLRAAGNDRRARALSMERLLTAEDPFSFPKSGWRPAQRGAGAYVLCKSCNEFAGAAYGGAYSRFAAWLEAGLAQLEGRLPSEGMILQHNAFPLGDVARAALVSLLRVSVGDAMVRRDPSLLRVVRDGALGLPSGVRIGMTIVVGAKIRHSPPHRLYGAGRGWSVFVEFAAQPLAWNLSYTGDGLVGIENSVDVSDWLLVPPRKLVALSLTVPTGMVFTAIPGD